MLMKTDALSEAQELSLLRQTNRLYESILHSLPNLVGIMDANFCLTFVNATFCQYFNCEAETVMQKSILEFFASSEQERIRSHLESVKDNLPIEYLEYQVLQSAEYTAWHEGTLSQLKDEKDQLMGLQWISRDVSERKRKEEQLRKNEERFQELYERTPVMVHSIDQSGRILSVSDRWLQALGYERSEVIGKPSTALLTEESRRYAKEVVLPLYFEKGVVQDVPYQMVKKNGDVIDVELSATAERNEDGEFVRSLAVLLDVTGRKRAEAELDRNADQMQQYIVNLERTNKELASFVYVASHDLQSPLRAISSLLQILQIDYQDQLDQMAHDLMERAVNATARMKELIGDLLDYTQVGQDNQSWKAVDLEDVLSGVLEDLNDLIHETGMRITYSDLPQVRGDHHQLKQLFQNLLTNGIKFRDAQTPTIHIEGADQSTEWQVSVSDNGIGIDPEYTERIFEIFQRLHTQTEYPGTGIGLAICKKIVELHNGRIWVESKLGEGSTFYFTFPQSIDGH